MYVLYNQVDSLYTLLIQLFFPCAVDSPLTLQEPAYSHRDFNDHTNQWVEEEEISMGQLYFSLDELEVSQMTRWVSSTAIRLLLRWISFLTIC